MNDNYHKLCTLAIKSGKPFVLGSEKELLAQFERFGLEVPKEKKETPKAKTPEEKKETPGNKAPKKETK